MIKRERVARKGIPREIEREDAAHAEIAEKDFALFGVNTLSAADKLRAAGAAQPRETADGFRVGLERAENGREGDHLVSQRTEKARSAAGRSDHAVGKKLLARAGGEGKAAALRGDGGDLRRAALRNAQRLAAETQYVEHGGGGVAARIDAAFFIRDRPEPERAKERAQRIARHVRKNGRDEIRPVIVLRRNVRIREIAPPVAGFEQFFADAVRLFKNLNVRSGLPGGDRRAEPARAAADHGDTARRFFSSHGMILPAFSFYFLSVSSHARTASALSRALMRLPGRMSAAGQTARRISAVFPMPLPPEVANGITVLPVKS